MFLPSKYSKKKSSALKQLPVREYQLQTNFMLGGVGKTVEIDESKFGKRKYHRGHHVEGPWVFGGYERGTGLVFMIAVPAR